MLIYNWVIINIIATIIIIGAMIIRYIIGIMIIVDGFSDILCFRELIFIRVFR